MKKTLLLLGVIATLTIASVAQAQSYTYSQASVSGGSSASVNVTNVLDGGPSDTQITVQSTTGGIGVPPIPKPPRPSNREIIDRIRNGAAGTVQVSSGPAGSQESVFEQHIESVNGSTSGQVHIFRKENGKVVEDRIVPLPKGAPGKPVMFRASTSMATGTPRGVMIRTLAASGSNAIFIRNTSGSVTDLGLPFLHMTDLSEASTVDAYGNVLFSFEHRQPPIEAFLGKVFNLFRKAAGN